MSECVEMDHNGLNVVKIGPKGLNIVQNLQNWSQQVKWVNWFKMVQNKSELVQMNRHWINDFFSKSVQWVKIGQYIKLVETGSKHIKKEKQGQKVKKMVKHISNIFFLNGKISF